MNATRIERERFDEAVAGIRREFPDLRIDVTQGHPNYEVMADIPAQPPRLAFSVGINLQNHDELHLTASHLWVEWFPCGDEEVFQRFMQAVSGLLSGRYRILESFVGRRPVKAALQRPIDHDAWETVACWSDLGILVPWKRTKHVVQNVPSA